MEKKVWSGDIESLETVRGLVYTVYDEKSYDSFQVDRIILRLDGAYEIVFLEHDLSDSDLIIYPSGIRQVFIKK